MKIALVACSALIAFSGVAFAADMPVKAPIQPMAAIGHNWSGFYLTGSAGYGWGSASNTLLFTDPTVAVPGAVPSNHVYDLNGFIGGGGAGYNYQLHNMVLGVEADISYAHLIGSTTSSGTFAPIAGPWAALLTSPFSYRETAKIDWLGTVRGRIGFVTGRSNRVLFYATGGLAYGHAKATTLLTFPNVSFVGENSGTRAGWTAGGGVEYAFDDRWTAKVEYLYYDLGSLLVDDVPIPPTPTFETWAKFPLHGSVARAGISYKLN